MRTIIDIIYSNKRRNELQDSNREYCEFLKSIVDGIMNDYDYEVLKFYSRINDVGRGDMTYVIDFPGSKDELKKFRKFIKRECDYTARAVCTNFECK
jgi:hypothetical protein